MEDINLTKCKWNSTWQQEEETPALSDATRESSAKTLQKDIMLKAQHHQKLTLANHLSPLNHLCPKDTFCPGKL